MQSPSKPPAEVQAYDTIRRQIVSGLLASGTRLTEQALAREMGLSRTPIRAAITRLVHEGFVERGDGYSTRVAEFPEEELVQLFEVRRRLECYAAERAAKLATEEQIAELDRLTTEMEAVTPPRSDSDYQKLSAANTAFHRILAEAAKSPRLMAVLAVAVDIGVVARTYQTYTEADLMRSVGHHRELVDAVRARAPDWASSVMSSHVLAAAHSISSARQAP